MQPHRDKPRPPAGLDAQALERVAAAAVDRVEDGMVLGLGTGRTAEAFLRRLGQRVAEGLRVRGVPTSTRSAAAAEACGIELTTLDTATRLDIDFDGADEVSPQLDLTKGMGGALLRERVVAHVAERFVVLITPDKRVDRLGTRVPIPVETVPFAVPVVTRELAQLGADPRPRLAEGGEPFRTDNGNAIVDARFDPIAEPAVIDAAIRAIPGVVDTGLFLAMADTVLIGGPDGVETLDR